VWEAIIPRRIYLMKFKKSEIIITVSLFIWLGLIVWGIAKTEVQLSRKALPKKAQVETKVALPKPEVKRRKEIITKKRIAKKPREEKKPRAEKKAAPSLVETQRRKTLPEVEVAPAPVPVRTFRIRKTDFKDILPAMGTVKGNVEIELKFEVNGIINQINFREGEKIKKTDLIASLDQKDGLLRLEYAKSKLKSTEAAYQSAQKKLETHQKLYDVGAIIKPKLEEVQLEAESAKFQVETILAEVRLAEAELNKTYLYAPKDGVMGPRDAEVGEFVTPQDKVASLLEIGDVLVEVGIVEKDIDKVKLGQKATVNVDAYPNIGFEGKVDNIFPVVEGRSRTLTTKIKVANPRGLLLPGMFARVEIFVVELKESFIIPSMSLITTGPGVTIVPVIPLSSFQKTEEGIQTGVTELRRVTLGYITTDYAQIVEGLNEDDLVIIESQGELRDRANVRIVGVEELTF
jgi:membrane fusion protein (multidrug efflux system)